MIGLCGQRVCRHLCSRVCHCPVGMAQVRWLWFYRRMERGGSGARPVPSLSCPPGVDPQTGEITGPEQDWSELNRPLRKKRLDRYPSRGQRQSAPLYTRNLKLLTTWPILMAFLTFMALVFLFAYFAYGPSFTPHYTVPNVHTWDPR